MGELGYLRMKGVHVCPQFFFFFPWISVGLQGP